MMRIYGSLAALSVFAVFVGCTTGQMAGSGAPQFVGSEKCSTCHQAEYQSWKATYHANMVRTRQDGLLKASRGQTSVEEVMRVVSQ